MSLGPPNGQEGAQLEKGRAQKLISSAASIASIRPAAGRKFFSFVFSENMYRWRRPASLEGRTRRHERRVRDAVGVSSCSVISGHADERGGAHGEVVMS